MKRGLTVFVWLAFVAVGVRGAEPIRDMEGGVYETSGTVKVISLLAKGCLRKESIEEIPASDLGIEEGIIKARVGADYNVFLAQNRVIATLNFAAKEGRFRLLFSDIEQKIGDGGYVPVYKGKLTGGEGALRALSTMAERVAACIRSEVTKNDW